MTLRIFKLGFFLVAARAAGGSPVRLAPRSRPPLVSPRALTFSPRAFTQDRRGARGGRIVLHAATIEVPSGFEHPPRAPVAPRAPRGERGTRRRLLRSTLAAASAAGEVTVAPPPWWRGSRDARIYLIHLPNADARVILRDVMRDRGEIAGYVPSSAYLCVVRDPSVAAEIEAALPGSVGDGAQAPSQDLPKPGHGRRRRC